LRFDKRGDGSRSRRFQNFSERPFLRGKSVSTQPNLGDRPQNQNQDENELWRFGNSIERVHLIHVWLRVSGGLLPCPFTTAGLIDFS
jgi:hypothetical protein